MIFGEAQRIMRRLIKPPSPKPGQWTMDPVIDPREKFVQIARGELGFGEESHNNQGPAVEKYRRGRGGHTSKAPWCADFVSWCILETWAAFALGPPIKLSPHARTLHKRIGRAGRFLANPEVGAVVCWARGKAGSRQGHIGIIERIVGPMVVLTIEGNTGAFPSKVRILRHDITHERVVGFARLPFISKESIS